MPSTRFGRQIFQRGCVSIDSPAPQPRPKPTNNRSASDQSQLSLFTFGNLASLGDEIFLGYTAPLDSKLMRSAGDSRRTFPGLNDPIRNRERQHYWTLLQLSYHGAIPPLMLPILRYHSLQTGQNLPRASMMNGYYSRAECRRSGSADLPSRANRVVPSSLRA